jgi:hypothetical protein
MLSLSPTQRIFLALEPVDMRKHFDGLNSDIGVKAVIPTCR